MNPTKSVRWFAAAVAGVLLTGHAAAQLLPAQQWQQVLTVATPPSRGATAMAYDSARGRTVVFGGVTGGSTFLADTWEFDGTNWAQALTTAVPPSRVFAALAYDSARHRIVLFGGGSSSGSPLADTWDFNGTNWTRVMTAASPSGRAVHAMVFDNRRNRVVLFGGIGLTGELADTWEFDGSNWTRVTTVSSPSPRMGHAVAHDTARGCTVLFGGENSSTWLADTWLYDGTNWSPVVTVNGPSGRSSHGLAYDISRGRTVLFGGGDGFLRNDTWELDGVNWTQVTTPVAPPFRLTTHLVYDSARGRAVLWGGNIIQQDTWELLPPASAGWTRHGNGCAGSAGVPALDALPNAVPALGTTFTLHVSGLTAQAGALYLAFGFDLATWNGWALPVDLGQFGLAPCRLWIAPASGLVLTHAGAVQSVPLLIPANPALAGLVVAAQALVFDAAAGNGTGAVTNAGVMRLF